MGTLQEFTDVRRLLIIYYATEHPHLLDIKPLAKKIFIINLGALINYNISTEALAKDIWISSRLFL